MFVVYMRQCRLRRGQNLIAHFIIDRTPGIEPLGLQVFPPIHGAVYSKAPDPPRQCSLSRIKTGYVAEHIKENCLSGLLSLIVVLQEPSGNSDNGKSVPFD